MVLQEQLSWIFNRRLEITIFVIGPIRASRQSFTSHVGIESTESTAQKALDYLFSNSLISVSVKGSNASMVDMQKSSTNDLPCDKVL